MEGRWAKWKNLEYHGLRLYVFNVGVALSQLLSAVLLGDPDETVSSRTGKAIRAGKPFFVHIFGPFLDILLMERDHAIKSIEPEEGKRQLWDWSK